MFTVQIVFYSIHEFSEAELLAGWFVVGFAIHLLWRRS